MHLLNLPVPKASIRSNLRRGVLALSGIALLVLPCASRAADLPSATRALLEGNNDNAVAQLKQILASDPSNGQVHLLLCRAYYAQSMASAAASECTAALRTLANDSSAQDWAGRAYGMQANGAGPIAGLRLAFKVRNAFEAAARLNPLNGDAVNDLSEYYIDAPSIVGGGLDKAALLADRSESQLPQNAHRMRAMAAEKQKDYGTAEREFRSATAVANQPDAWADLGAFYSRRTQPDKAVEALRRAIALDRAHEPRSWMPRRPSLRSTANHASPSVPSATISRHIPNPTPRLPSRFTFSSPNFFVTRAILRTLRSNSSSP